MILFWSALSLFFCFVTSDQHYNEKEGAIIETINDFGFDLLKIFHQQQELKDENIFYSPTSLSVAVAMVYLGARENTARQISQAFKWYPHEFEDVHLAFKSLHEAILESAHEDLELKMANRIWSHDELEETSEFRENSQVFYHANMAKVDFRGSSDKARQEINTWVEQNTGKKIKDFLPPGTVNQDTRLALINAIYFKGAWQHAFQQEKSFHAPFYMSSNRENVFEANMMSRTSKQNYFSDNENECQMLELPFSGGDVTMFVILPNEIDGVGRVEQMINTEVLSRWIALLENTTVKVSVPKFLLSQHFDLKNILKKVGIEDLFEPGAADLSGMSTGESLHVSHVIHKAHVEVNERGAEAAAASGVVVQKRSLDLHPVFFADHPFLFVIYHKSSSAVLFIGRVMKPSVALEQEEANATNKERDNPSFLHGDDEL